MKNSLILTTVLSTTTLIAIQPMTAMSYEQGDWIVRVGVTSVQPDESSSTISTTATGALPDTAVGVDGDTQIGLNIAYMWSDHIGIELLASTPFEHDIKAKGLDLYGFNTTDLGSAKHLPPTLSAQYYFMEAQSPVRPYVGVGINYTAFFSESLSSDAKTELAANGLDLDDSIGLSAQIGIDWSINKKWLINASIWHMDIDTTATFDSALGQVSVDVDIDPWAYMVSAGYKF